jgi:uncharacterized protein YlxW (UPF0749 family)
MAVDTQPTVGDPAAPAPVSKQSAVSRAWSSTRSRVAAWRAQGKGSYGLPLLSGVLLLGGIILGAILATDWRAQPADDVLAGAPVTRQSGREIVAGTIKRLEEEQADLKAQIAGLRAQVNALQQDSSLNEGVLLDLRRDLERQRLASGLVPMRGPGVVATLNDSDARSVPEGVDPANYIIHEYDLRDVLNALWSAGAEAISLNGERIVGNTSLYCVGTTIMCNATRLSPPYRVSAIGNPEALTAALWDSAQMSKFNRRAQQYSIPFTVEEASSLELPAYNGSFIFKYAAVEEGSDD